MINLVAVVVVRLGMLWFMLHSACNLQVQVQYCGITARGDVVWTRLRSCQKQDHLLFTQA